ncbi:hypothetical protein DFH94DRAFT_684334 [Russula ochroleuca]|uniref:Uncharacterized protein n=1 Tax=Russula ochroleuca TaxID=152965 RepID=A0A9P5K1M4_9AGAM|nr:hypothetical protein DFH94DRAFT_684334 [Russula ochroleuca]
MNTNARPQTQTRGITNTNTNARPQTQTQMQGHKCKHEHEATNTRPQMQSHKHEATNANTRDRESKCKGPQTQAQGTVNATCHGHPTWVRRRGHCGPARHTNTGTVMNANGRGPVMNVNTITRGVMNANEAQWGLRRGASHEREHGVGEREAVVYSVWLFYRKHYIALHGYYRALQSTTIVDSNYYELSVKGYLPTRLPAPTGAM